MSESRNDLLKRIKDENDFYKILGVEKTCSEDEIKKAYKKLLLQVHPDKNLDNEDAGDAFKNLNKAYQVLSHPGKRKIYDRGGEEALSDLPAEEDTEEMQFTPENKSHTNFDPPFYSNNIHPPRYFTCTPPRSRSIIEDLDYLFDKIFNISIDFNSTHSKRESVSQPKRNVNVGARVDVPIVIVLLGRQSVHVITPVTFSPAFLDFIKKANTFSMQEHVAPEPRQSPGSRFRMG